jgi:hypothetical protein
MAPYLDVVQGLKHGGAVRRTVRLENNVLANPACADDKISLTAKLAAL